MTECIIALRLKHYFFLEGKIVDKINLWLLVDDRAHNSHPPIK